MEIYQSCARQILRNFFFSRFLLFVNYYHYLFQRKHKLKLPVSFTAPFVPSLRFLFFFTREKVKNDGAVYVSVKFNVSRATFNEPNLDIRASFSNEILSRERESVLHIRDQNVNTRKIFLVPIVLRFVEQGEIRSVVTIRTTRFPEDFPTFSFE